MIVSYHTSLLPSKDHSSSSSSSLFLISRGLLFLYPFIMSLLRYVKLRMPATLAKPGPAIGQALGPLGLNMADFCKQFNEKSQQFKPNTPLRVELAAFNNRTFTFTVRTPPTSYLIKQAIGLAKGSGSPGNDIVGKISHEAIYEIAKLKQLDDHVSHRPLDGIAKSVLGTAISMGVEIQEESVEDGVGQAAAKN
jgi:large subunit ribosomal protein L11